MAGLYFLVAVFLLMKPVFSQGTDCEGLTDPQNGAVSVSGTTEGSTATYTCNIGFNLVGDESRTCQANGDWSGSAPTCQIVECAVLNNPLNGDVTPTGTTFGSTASYTCAAGYMLTGGSSFRVCRPSGLWSSSAPTCIPVDCGPLSNPVNGQVELNGTSFMATASYSCSDGFGLEGEASRMCLASGLWSGSEPQCTVDCGALSDPANGSVVHSSTLVGSSASYTCDEGFVISEVAVRVCTSSREWSGVQPACNAVDCGNLTSPQNGEVVQPLMTTFESEAVYTCSIGFNLVGMETRRCQADATWSGNEPVCDMILCPALFSPTNGIIFLSNISVGSEASYSCFEGYTLVGNATRQCQSSGQWTPSEPICEDVDCGNLTSPENGTVVFASTAFEALAVYSCNEGYSLDQPEDVRQCLANGSWSLNEPQCLLVDCGALVDLSNGAVNVSGTVFGGQALYSCNPGFLLTGDVLRTCGADGIWDPREPTCIPLECAALAAPVNGIVLMPSRTVGSTALYSCNEGFELTGEMSSTCLFTRQWNGTAPTCTIVECGGLPPVENGEVALSGTVFSSEVRYSCTTGFTVSGNTLRTCQASGEWSGSDPTCNNINECLEGSSGCDTNADCVDTQGGFNCSCLEGFTGTGLLCEEMAAGLSDSETIIVGAVVGGVGGVIILVGVVVLLLLAASIATAAAKRRKMNRKKKNEKPSYYLDDTDMAADPDFKKDLGTVESGNSDTLPRNYYVEQQSATTFDPRSSVVPSLARSYSSASQHAVRNTAIHDTRRDSASST